MGLLKWGKKKKKKKEEIEEQSVDAYLGLFSISSEQFEYDPILKSDDKYAEELQFQETLLASISNISLNGSAPKRSKEIGESSQTLCEICAERRDNDQMFPIQNCSHQFCNLCITKYIATRLQKSSIVNLENARVLTCPVLDCRGILEIDACRKNVSQSVIAMWDSVICESLIDSSQKFYCPYKDCSLSIAQDGDEVIMKAECPFCRRFFCVQCNVPWHSGVGCEEFKRLKKNERGKEDLMVHELAKRKNWKQCPHCKFFVEKVEGCLHISCRCGNDFCYACGETWTSTHDDCQ